MSGGRYSDIKSTSGQQDDQPLFSSVTSANTVIHTMWTVSATARVKVVAKNARLSPKLGQRRCVTRLQTSCSCELDATASAARDGSVYFCCNCKECWLNPRCCNTESFWAKVFSSFCTNTLCTDYCTFAWLVVLIPLELS